MNALFTRDNSVFYAAACISLFISIILNYSEIIINNDGICYLLSAEMIKHKGLLAAMNLCGQAKWPFYSILIYFLANLTTLSYLAAAKVCNAVFSMLSVVFFLCVIKALGGTRRILYIAAAVILLSHTLNDVRQYIIRDHGFWTFYLASLYFFLCYVKFPRWHYAILFNASLALATLFRIEGILFLILLPLVTWFEAHQPLRTKLRQYAQLNVLTFFVASSICIWLLTHAQYSIDHLGRLPEVLDQFKLGLHTIYQRFSTTKLIVAQSVLVSYSARDAGLVLALMLVCWYIVNVINNLSWIYAALVAYAAFSSRIFFVTHTRRVLLAYLLINIVITLAFLLEYYFISKRYLVALSLVLMLWVPFAIDQLISKFALNQQYKLLSPRVMAVAISVGILFSACGGLFNFGYSKKYIHDAGAWLALNVPKSEKIYINDNQLMYYSQHFGLELFRYADQFQQQKIAILNKVKLQQYDYLALRLNVHAFPTSETRAMLGMTPVQVFNNNRGDRVEIYKIKNVE